MPFHIHTDGSDRALGVVFGQQKFNFIKDPSAIYYTRENVLGEQNYIVTENNFLLNKFRHYITHYQVFVHTKNSTIKYLMNKS